MQRYNRALAHDAAEARLTSSPLSPRTPEEVGEDHPPSLFQAVLGGEEDSSLSSVDEGGGTEKGGESHPSSQGRGEEQPELQVWLWDAVSKAYRLDERLRREVEGVVGVIPGDFDFDGVVDSIVMIEEPR